VSEFLEWAITSRIAPFTALITVFAALPKYGVKPTRGSAISYTPLNITKNKESVQSFDNK
jgi:hypothetical protein